MGSTGIYTFLFSLNNMDSVYSLEPPPQGGPNMHLNLCLVQKKGNTPVII